MPRSALISLLLAIAAGAALAGCSEQKNAQSAAEANRQVRIDQRLNVEKEKIQQAEDLRKLNDQKAQDIISQ